MNAVPAHGDNGGDRPGSDGSAGSGSDLSRAADAARSLSRRRFLRAAGFAAASVPLSSALAACSGGSGSDSGTREVRIGYVSPQTGSLSDFSDVDAYTTAAMQDIFKNGIQVGSQRHPVRIIVRDSQSDTNRAAQAASDLIFKDKVDVILVSSSSDTTNPVADQCEANGVPCISTAAPWESWYRGRGGRSDRPFIWTYHVYWGLDDLGPVYKSMWDEVPGGTNKKIGLLLPHDTDGDQFQSKFPNFITSNGYTVPQNAEIRYDNLSADIANSPTAMAGAGAEILCGVPLATDFQTFWRNAATQNQATLKPFFAPKVVTISRALLFQSDLLNLGSLGFNLSTEVSWSPSHQFKSSLSGMTAKALADDFTAKTGKLWVQTLGFTHAMFEVLAKALAGVTSIDDQASIARAIGGVRNLNSMVGPIAFGGGNVVSRNVAKTPLVGGQWQKTKGATSYELFVTTSQNPLIRPTQSFKLPSPGTGSAA